jgi:hypothetical protein
LRASVLLTALASAVAAGCASGDGGIALSVDLRTDLTPGAEFDVVVTTLDGAGSASLPVTADRRGGAARRVAEFRDLRPGPRLLGVELRRAGRAVLTRRVAVRLDASAVVTVVMTRSCAAIACPGAGDAPDATECEAGRCVAPGCGAPGEPACGGPVCRADAECPAAVDCVRARCIDGACYALADSEACAPTEECDAVRGCVPRAALPDAGPPDAGPPDASLPDASGPDVGPPPPVDAFVPPAPEVVFSATLDGPPTSSFFADQTIFGRIFHTGPTETQGCAEVSGTSDGFCDVVSNFTPLPNADWSYDATSAVWRATVAPFAFPPNVYRLYARNTSTGARSAPAVLILRAARPLLIFSTTRDGPPVSVVSSSVTLHGRVLYLGADDAEACVEVVGRDDGACDGPASFTRMPNADWSFEPSTSTWRATFAPGAFPPLTYRCYFRRSTSGERSLPVVVTVTP